MACIAPRIVFLSVYSLGEVTKEKISFIAVFFCSFTPKKIFFFLPLEKNNF